MTDFAGFLIPPRRITRLDGSFTWPARPLLAAAASEDLLPLRQLAGDLGGERHPAVRVAPDGARRADVLIRRDRAVSEPEGYALRVKRDGIVIESATAAGAYYAMQTLREFRRLNETRLPCCRITDRPDFRRRGVYLDCSRGKVPTVATLKRLLEQLADWKVNELQLYVENVFAFRKHPLISRGFSPFTPEELLAVQDHARRHHIRFVPSLASFGHFERILARPEYAHLGELPGHREFAGGTTLCPGDPRSLKLVADLYGEFLPLFDSVEFNACCDETWELGRGRSRARANRRGVGRVYLDFVRALRRLCNRHGKRMNIWADIVLAHPELVKDVPLDIVMLNWDYAPDGKRIAMTRKFPEAGLAFLVCPGTSGWGSHGTRLRNAMDNVRVFAARGRRHGAEGLLNTDWGDFGHRNTLGVSLHGYAHGAAHAWNGAAVNERRFTALFCRHVLGAPSSKSAASLRALGETEEKIGPHLPYYSFTQSLWPDRHVFSGLRPLSPVYIAKALRRDRFGAARAEGCREVIAGLPALTWDPIPPGADPWIARAMDDFQLAAEMDRLAARRILMAKLMRSGQSAPLRDRRRLADELRALVRRFRANWLGRNKPSRLGDNLTLFANVIGELTAG